MEINGAAINFAYAGPTGRLDVTTPVPKDPCILHTPRGGQSSRMEKPCPSFPEPHGNRLPKATLIGLAIAPLLHRERPGSYVAGDAETV